MAKIKNYDKYSVLQHIFDVKIASGHKIGEDIDFTLAEVNDAILATKGVRPASISNFVLDLTRKDTGISTRLPQSIIEKGYDLRKKTGKGLCGTFIYRGFDEHGKTIPLNDWLVWPTTPDRPITITNKVPDIVQRFISNDEASLLSIIDYCDILTKVYGSATHKIYRVQSPMKWQPNEIDGYYIGQKGRNTILYPVEAKAISTKDDINLVQMYGQYETFIKKYRAKYARDGLAVVMRPIAAKMTKDGMLLARLENNPMYDSTTNRNVPMFTIDEVVEVILDPPILNWGQKTKRKKRK